MFHAIPNTFVPSFAALYLTLLPRLPFPDFLRKRRERCPTSFWVVNPAPLLTGSFHWPHSQQEDEGSSWPEGSKDQLCSWLFVLAYIHFLVTAQVVLLSAAQRAGGKANVPTVVEACWWVKTKQLDGSPLNHVTQPL